MIKKVSKKKPYTLYTSKINFDKMKAIYSEGKDVEPTNKEVWEFALHDKDLEYNEIYDSLDRTTNGRIIAFGNLYRNGKYKKAFRIFPKNLHNLLYSQEGELTLSYDGEDVTATDKVHGGTNYYLYRELREDTDYIPFLMAVFYQKEVTTGEVDKYTKPLDIYIEEQFGVFN